MVNENLTSGINSEDVSVNLGEVYRRVPIGHLTDNSMISGFGAPKYENMNSSKNIKVYQTPMKIRVFEKSVLEKSNDRIKDPRDLVIEHIHKHYNESQDNQTQATKNGKHKSI